MFDKRPTKQFYDHVYKQYRSGASPCLYSMDNLDKARRRVNLVFKTFRLWPLPKGARVLDVGCGLGYMSEALRLAGGIVTGIDFSSMAIDLARKSFPNVDFRCLSFPDELEKSDQFDIVWSVDLTIINTFDVDQIYRNLIEPCLLLLQPNGVLIIGWHTDFSGRMKSGTACWSLQTINDLKLYAGLSAPRVVDVRFSLLSKLIIIASRFFRRSIPVFFVRNRDKIQA